MDGVGLGIKGSDLYVCLGLQSIGVGVGCKVAIGCRVAVVFHVLKLPSCIMISTKFSGIAGPDRSTL